MGDHHSSPKTPEVPSSKSRLSSGLRKTGYSPGRKYPVKRSQKNRSIRRILFGAENIEAADRSAEEAHKKCGKNPPAEKMNLCQKHSPLIVRNRAYRQAFERLDEALDKNALSSNAEKIAAMRATYFADVDELGEVDIPKRKL
jgi:hypothetical protein